MRLFTGEISLDLGSTGVLAHNAAFVNCETKEKLLSELELLNTRFIFDLSPDDCICGGLVDAGMIYNMIINIAHTDIN